MINFSQYANDFIGKLELKKKNTGEYAGRCPNCGGEDRFRISDYGGELKHHCRKECSLADRTNALRGLGLIPEFQPVSVPYHQKKNIPLLGGAELEGDVLEVPITELKTSNLRHTKDTSRWRKAVFYRDEKKWCWLLYR